MDLQAQFDSLMKLQGEAYGAGQYRRAAETARAAVKIAEAMGNQGHRVMALFWEGASWTQVQEKEAALVVLLEAGNAVHPEVDPVYTYQARTLLIDIAAKIKPRADIAELIKSTRRFLEEIGKESWDHRIDLLMGELESSRGEHGTAFAYSLRSWQRYVDDRVSYTQATHLEQLYRGAFALRNSDGLKRYWGDWGRCRMATEGCEIVKIDAESLLMRAERSWLSDTERALSVSRTLLRRASALDSKTASCLAALRLLALCGAFDEVDLHWKRYGAKNKRPDFGDRLCEADLALIQARSFAGMPVIDDEWDTEFPLPQPPFPNGPECLAKLHSCEALYRNLLDLAVKEDARLETGYYSRTLQERLDRVRIIRETVEANP